ncbi:hypothetical protein [Lysinibacillus sp. BPa_S21]|uniref:hypothetical protein n=1 Tax=Lysinibacillus sp. BPa_S21 TaxID=2932478 RepID=UPI00201142CA|nr:hypothetical protein [Lysinibacillus sp. BPa_S21]MCL1696302.1 hypothetical protein [Lysinibacillus sp. BPa_S21]
MKQELRDAIAYIAGNLISNNISASIYSLDTRSHIQFSGELTTDKVIVYDTQMENKITGKKVGAYINCIIMQLMAS